MKKKRMGKRWMVIALAVGMGVQALAGCGGASSGEAEKDAVVLPKLEENFEASDFTQQDVDSDTIQWMCSAYSIYTAYNKKELGVIGGVLQEDKDTNQIPIQLALASGWGIEERDDVEDVLEELLEEGHRASYRETIAKMEKEELLSLSEEEALAAYDPDDEDLYRYQAAYRAYEKYGEHGIDGWDYCRALQILGDCYQAEYLNLEETLDLSLPIAQKLQSTYEDWTGVAESYLYGYQYWQKEDADSAGETFFRWETYQELLDQEYGPYTVNYDTELTNTWKNGADQKAAQEAKDAAEGYEVLRNGETLSVKVRIPEGYTARSVSDEEGRRYEKLREDSAVHGIQVSYNLKEKSDSELEFLEGEIQRKTESYLANEDYQEVRGTELKELQVGERTVYYAMMFCAMKEYDIQTMYCTSWTVQDERILECEVKESDLRGAAMELTEDGVFLEALYSDIIW